MNPAYFEAAELRLLSQVASGAVITAILFGALLTDHAEYFLGYVAVVITALSPSFVWIRRGAVGLPIFPVVALFYIPIFALVILNGDVDRYTPAQVLRAELTVALFLSMALLSWLGTAFQNPSAKFNADRGLALEYSLLNLTLCGLLLGVVFEIGIYLNWWGWFGSWFGTFRSFMLSATSISSFLFGIALGQRGFAKAQLTVASLLLASIVFLENSSLQLHSSIVLLLGALTGYAITAKKIPWLGLALFIVLFSILQAAKADIRAQYWTQNQETGFSLAGAPGATASWILTGIEKLTTGTTQQSGQGQKILDRASQLNMLLLAQEQSPENIPFLNGETYANFPQLIIPRFLAPDKIASQQNLNLLSIHYRLQSSEDTRFTTIAWNIVPEAFANFGYWGVVFAGIIFGLLAGGITWLTSGAPALSLRGLIGLAALVTLIDVEYDFGYLLLNLIQTTVSIAGFFLLINLLSGSQRRIHKPMTSIHEGVNPSEFNYENSYHPLRES